MDDNIRVFSGRTFRPEDIELIKWARKSYAKLTRKELAATICELIDWNTIKGSAKIPQCLEYLTILESKGILQLPPIRAYRKRNVCKQELTIKIEGSEIVGKVSDFEPIQLSIARPGEELKRWRFYVNKYHMLGDKNVFGSRLCYFIKSGDTELGCIQFSASAWALEERDNWIGWTVEDRKAQLNLIINNSRYLIFPCVKIKNLASKALSLIAKQIQEDWIREFCYAPVLLETFVDIGHFKGTCYKAANWKYLGETKGRGRMDRNNEYSLSKKAIFMYPLQNDFKEVLKGKKPFKAVNPYD